MSRRMPSSNPVKPLIDKYNINDSDSAPSSAPCFPRLFFFVKKPCLMTQLKSQKSFGHMAQTWFPGMTVHWLKFIKKAERRSKTRMGVLSSPRDVKKKNSYHCGCLCWNWVDPEWRFLCHRCQSCWNMTDIRCGSLSLKIKKKRCHPINMSCVGKKKERKAGQRKEGIIEKQLSWQLQVSVSLTDGWRRGSSGDLFKFCAGNTLRLIILVKQSREKEDSSSHLWRHPKVVFATSCHTHQWTSSQVSCETQNSDNLLQRFRSELYGSVFTPSLDTKLI